METEHDVISCLYNVISGGNTKIRKILSSRRHDDIWRSSNRNELFHAVDCSATIAVSGLVTIYGCPRSLISSLMLHSGHVMITVFVMSFTMMFQNIAVIPRDGTSDSSSDCSADGDAGDSSTDDELREDTYCEERSLCKPCELNSQLPPLKLPSSGAKRTSKPVIEVIDDEPSANNSTVQWHILAPVKAVQRRDFAISLCRALA